MENQIRTLAQSYLGMTPKDKGCTNWSELQNKFTADLLKIVNQNIISGDISLTCSCGKALHVSTSCSICDNDE